MAAPKPGYCIAVYDGSGKGVPSHLAKRFTVQGMDFDSGVETEITDTGASCAMAAAFPGTLKIVAGTPKPWEPTRAIHRVAASERADQGSPFHRHPAVP